MAPEASPDSSPTIPSSSALSHSSAPAPSVAPASATLPPPVRSNSPLPTVSLDPDRSPSNPPQSPMDQSDPSSTPDQQYPQITKTLRHPYGSGKCLGSKVYGFSVSRKHGQKQRASGEIHFKDVCLVTRNREGVEKLWPTTRDDAEMEVEEGKTTNRCASPSCPHEQALEEKQGSLQCIPM